MFDAFRDFAEMRYRVAAAIIAKDRMHLAGSFHPALAGIAFRRNNAGKRQGVTRNKNHAGLALQKSPAPIDPPDIVAILDNVRWGPHGGPPVHHALGLVNDCKRLYRRPVQPLRINDRADKHVPV